MSSIAFAQSNTPIKIGHRGAMGHIAENTVESVQKALDMGCDAIEIDIYRVKDGSLMVFHDETLERTSNGKGKIENYTKEELKQLFVDGQYQIPTLEEVINTINKQVVLNIELKGANTAEATAKVIETFKAKGWTDSNFIISSFKWNELEIMRQNNSNIDIAVLTSKDPADAIDFAHKVKAVAINPHFKKLNKENVSKIKQANLKIYPWTVNEIEDIQRMKSLQVDGIITNFLERL